MSGLIILCLIVGITFNGLGAIALYRFPDVYTRLHGATKATTFGSIFTSLGVIIYGFSKWISTGEARFCVLAIHAILALIALLLTNPTGAHAIARAAHRSGVMPKRAVVDKLAEKEGKW
ncbi:MAG: monovalent cation/H(+) antiporter subunit G [Synergistetes bacterium]|nr:monovalent cation/H(+) antiporter subunit G [Synergistota bacterium]MCX8127721.1 monovalent cation/H(+) antiporter subunit G [Synergistota bacterium]MDW8191364.1 monovalent cation/H(+) antiporter subunit G [Synergistota bacterium]